MTPAIARLGMRLAINRADLPAGVRAAIMDAMQTNGEFARADERGDESAEVHMRRAQAAEGDLCDRIAEALAATPTL